MPRRRALLAALVAGGLALAGCGGNAVAGRPSPAPSPSPSAAYGWYLSLGDSLAFGYQEATFQAEKKAGTADPTRFDTGYADLVAARLRERDPGLVTENLGCAAETTDTYLHGGCPAQQGGLLHVPYAGPQAVAAQAFLAARTGPGLVTLALGANDAFAVLAACPDLSTSCVLPRLAPGLAAMQANLETILRAVRAAAPAATVLVLQDYDPYVRTDSRAGTAIDLLDGYIATAATAVGATLVDARPVFDPPGTATTTICAMTGICGPYEDIHPSDAGYAALARLFLQAAGVS